MCVSLAKKITRPVTFCKKRTSRFDIAINKEKKSFKSPIAIPINHDLFSSFSLFFYCFERKNFCLCFLFCFFGILFHRHRCSCSCCWLAFFRKKKCEAECGNGEKAEKINVWILEVCAKGFLFFIVLFVESFISLFYSSSMFSVSMNFGELR